MPVRIREGEEQVAGTLARSPPAALRNLAQLTFTWMLLGFASGFSGRWMASVPCFDSAWIFSVSKGVREQPVDAESAHRAPSPRPLACEARRCRGHPRTAA